MKTSVMKVHDMLSVLSVLGVEKRIGEVPGVESVTVDFAAGSATVRFDETRLSLADIRSDVRQIGSKDDAAAPDTEPVAPKTAAASADAKPAGDAPPAPGSPPSDKAAADAKPPATPTSAADATPAAGRPQGKTGES